MDVFRIARGEPIEIAFKNHSHVQWLLNQLHDYYDLSWPQIARLPVFNAPGEPEIPFSTFSKIAKKGIIPTKWRYRFPGAGAIDDRPRTSINLASMASTAKTLENKTTPEQRLELIQLLANDPQIPALIMIVKKDQP